MEEWPLNDIQKDILSGMIAGASEPFFMTPVRRGIFMKGTTGVSVVQGMQNIWKKQGPQALWLGVRTSMVRNMLGMGIFFGSASFF